MASYADSMLTRLDGKSVEWYDDGRLWSEGNYKAGLKTGFWKEEGTEYDIKTECLRVVKKMPKWNPGMVEDKPVRVRYKLPVRFRLE